MAKVSEKVRRKIGTKPNLLPLVVVLRDERNKLIKRVKIPDPRAAFIRHLLDAEPNWSAEII